VGAVSLVIGLVAGALLHATLAPGEVRVIVREIVVDAGAPSAEIARRPEVPEMARAPEAEPIVEAPQDDRITADPTRAIAPPASVRRPQSPRPEPAPAIAAPEPAPDDSTSPAAPEGDLMRESALLARAQSAVARGASEHAIAALREHAARFPEGQLREEREALWVSALVRAGDLAAAEQRARQFRERFPGSPLQPTVDAALRAP
jgi:TolA-binding protein